MLPLQKCLALILPSGGEPRDTASALTLGIGWGTAPFGAARTVLSDCIWPEADLAECLLLVQSGPHSGDTILAAKELDSAPVAVADQVDEQGKRSDISLGTLQASHERRWKDTAPEALVLWREGTLNKRKRLGAARRRLVPILCQTQSRRGEELRVTWEEFRAAITFPWMIGSTSSRAG